jgi:hypothetical protein
MKEDGETRPDAAISMEMFKKAGQQQRHDRSRLQIVMVRGMQREQGAGDKNKVTRLAGLNAKSTKYEY